MPAIQIYNFLQANPLVTHRSFKITLNAYDCCHIAMVKNGNILTIHGSGTKKFKITVTYKPTIGRHLITPKYYAGANQVVVTDILDKVLVKLNAPALPHGVKPKWAKGIFIRRNLTNASNANFRIAKNSCYFHVPFINFCQRNGFYCYIK